jgi:hypothetical protein
VLEFDVKCPEDGPKKKKKVEDSADKAAEKPEGKTP